MNMRPPASLAALTQDPDPADGLARAKAREAPEGYESNPVWTMPYGMDQTDKNSLERIYRERAGDRKRAFRAKNPYDVSLFGPQLPQWDAFYEGLNHNDTQAQVGGAPKVRGGLSPVGSNQMRGESVQPDEYTLTSYGNPAGMTQGAAQRDARKFAQGGAMPDWYAGATDPTQDMFRARVGQYKPSMRSLKG